jgi:hypothetical protein
MFVLKSPPKHVNKIVQKVVFFQEPKELSNLIKIIKIIKIFSI